MTDLEKLNRYSELIQKKRKKTKFDRVEFGIHGNVRIQEEWTNDENGVSKTWKFPFSMIDHFIAELEKELQ